MLSIRGKVCWLLHGDPRFAWPYDGSELVEDDCNLLTFSPQVVKTVAIRQGLQLACESGLYPVTFESDTKVVIDWINNGSKAGANVELIIVDILALLKSLGCVSVCYTPRQANQVAHYLAKNALSNDEDCYWLEEYPPCVSHFVMVDGQFSL
ncbi:hypothetical protein Dsin_032042 [Dipteronia sinensis]|uniref:RNase H type-1 domain-containing protein n=1 Tax=Dipteronia sinensis TaxID=43782 RepID=A0AAE0DSP7_9ROSI|nr:hypothetical protein Dsin_032042 [Dipteronia sinensis]